jgi:large subunit ribosomal protein L28
MGMGCDYCDKAPVFGRKYSRRGKAKYLGGNGRKTTGITIRRHRPNLQRVRVQEGEAAVVRHVCVKCIRAGVVQKAIVRQPFTIETPN